MSGFLNAWSHEQHFSKYHFLGICQYVFAWISIMKKQNTNQNVKLVVLVKIFDHYHHKFESWKLQKKFETEIQIEI